MLSHDDVGRYDEAHAWHSKALEVYRAGLGWHHPKVAWAHEGIGHILQKQGKLDKAQEHLDSAVEIRSMQQARRLTLPALSARRTTPPSDCTCGALH